jgi:transcriptional regulator NrdR family protein
MLPKDETRYVFVELPACPACGSTHRKVYRSTRVDGGKSQHSKCLDCEHRFIVVMEVSTEWNSESVSE